MIADATFLDPAERARLQDLAADLAIPFQGVWLDAPRRVLERRIQARHGDASDADLNVLAKQFEQDIGATSWTVVEASGEPDHVAVDVHARVSASNAKLRHDR